MGWVTKRTIHEIDQELNKISKERTRLSNDSMYYDGRRWRWRDLSAISEINRMTRRIRRLEYERNQAVFRDWGKLCEKDTNVV